MAEPVLRSDLKIKLVSITEDLTQAWQSVQKDFPDLVEVVPRSILEVEADAWVSPANSFGIMDGGIDLVYLRYFGLAIQHRVQTAIDREKDGELLVGDTVTVEIPPVLEKTATAPRYMIVAPTMRVPEPLPPDTVNPYLAMRAILRAWTRWGAKARDDLRPIKTIAVPGLGTLTGRVPAELCARQVRFAIEEWALGYETPASWSQVQRKDFRLLAGND